MAAKKAATKKGKHGGKRKGAGRPLGSGHGPGINARTNRVSAMFNNTELGLLTVAASKEPHPNADLAKAGKKMPVSTLVHRLVMVNFKGKKTMADEPKAPAKKKIAKKKAAGKKKAAKSKK